MAAGLAAAVLAVRGVLGLTTTVFTVLAEADFAAGFLAAGLAAAVAVLVAGFLAAAFLATVFLDHCVFCSSLFHRHLGGQLLGSQLSGLGLGCTQLHAHRCLAPDFFQAVVLANGGLHDVADGRAAVHDDPFAVLLTFLAGHGKACFLDGFAHAGGQRLGLAVGGTGGHDHALEQRGQRFGVEHLDVVGLDVFETVNNGSLEFGDVALGCGIRFGGGGHQAMGSVNDGINIACAAPRPYQGWVSVSVRSVQDLSFSRIEKG